jgi:hypothetical protein
MGAAAAARGVCELLQGLLIDGVATPSLAAGPDLVEWDSWYAGLASLVGGSLAALHHVVQTGSAVMIMGLQVLALVGLQVGYPIYISSCQALAHFLEKCNRYKALDSYRVVDW